ncbi:hypothetical protein GGR52DRAFT_522730 [Hypoxylon sp. FL1284]|nr:hypothetical protein GGR52DRAFT_522730 [Hypoxylon sp. FL1284]
MAIISWRTFGDYVTTSMEHAPVTYTVFFIIFLQDEPSVSSIFRVAKTFMFRRRLKSGISMIFIIFTMLFLLGWPTFSGAMTGYTAVVNSYVRDYDGNYISFSQFRPLAYIIHDGQRVNLTEDYTVSYVDTDVQDGKGAIMLKNYCLTNLTEEPVINSYGYFYISYCEIRDDGNPPTAMDSRCTMQSNVSHYVASYGFYGLNDTTSVWHDRTIPGPVLNISAFYIPGNGKDFGFYGSDWVDPRDTDGKKPFGDISKMTFGYSNRTYTLDYIQFNGSCQPNQELDQQLYIWGFSFIQVYIQLILLMIWTMGIYAMWRKAQVSLAVLGQPEVPRGWRSILIMAEQMNRELKAVRIDPHHLTDRQLKKEIKKLLRGGSVDFAFPPSTTDHGSVRKWMKSNWPILLLLTLIIGGCNWFLFVVFVVELDLWNVFTTPVFYLLVCFILLYGAAVFAMVVGSTTRSKFLILLCWTIMMSIPIAVLMAYWTGALNWPA